MSDIRDQLAELRAEISTNPAQARHGLPGLLAAFEGAAPAGDVSRSDWLDLANCFLDLSEFSEAIEILKRVLKNYGDDPMVSLKILTALGRRGLNDDLINLPAQLRALDPLLPKDKETLPLLVEQVRLTNSDEAERYEDKWVEVESDNPWPWIDVGRWALDRAFFVWTIGTEPRGFADAKKKRARRHLAGARRVLQGTYAIQAWLWNALYLQQIRAGMMSESAESAAALFRLEPTNLEGMLRVLRLYAKFPNIITASEIDLILAQLLARQSEPASFWRDVAMLCSGVGRAAEKRVALDRCLSLTPNDNFARLMLRNLDREPQHEVAMATRRLGPDKSGTKRKWWRRPFG